MMRVTGFLVPRARRSGGVLLVANPDTFSRVFVGIEAARRFPGFDGGGAKLASQESVPVPTLSPFATVKF
jgi:hypothetical protein